MENIIKGKAYVLGDNIDTPDRDTYTEDMLNLLFHVIEGLIDKHFNGTIQYLSETTNEYTRQPDALVMDKIDWEKALESLTQAQREIITACDIEGKTQEEVANQRREEKWRVVRQRLDAFANGGALDLEQRLSVCFVLQIPGYSNSHAHFLT